MNSQVHVLNLNLAIHEKDQGVLAALRQAVTDHFIRGVLDAFDQHISVRFGSDAIVWVQSLNVHCGLDRKRITDRVYIEKLGQELAQQLVYEVYPYPDNRPFVVNGGHTVVLFKNRAHYRAVQISEQVTTEKEAWHYQDRTSGNNILATVLAEGHAGFRQVLTYLEILRTLDAMVRHWGKAEVKRMLSIVPLVEWPKTALASLRTKLAEPDLQSNTGAAKEILQRKSQTTFVQTSTHKDGARSDEMKPGGTRDGHPRKNSVDPVGADRNDKLHQTGPLSPVRGEAAANLKTEVPSLPLHNVGHHQGAGLNEKIGYQHSTSTQQLPVASVRNARPGGDKDWLVTDQVPGQSLHDKLQNSVPYTPISAEYAPAPNILTTRYAGLFYLLNPILELELPELLWCAGIDEGIFLWHMCRLLLGEGAADDPAPSVLSIAGGKVAPRLTNIPEWAAAEVKLKTSAALQQMYNRRNSTIFVTETAGEIQKAMQSLHLFDKQGGASELLLHCAAISVLGFSIRLGETFEADSYRQYMQFPGRVEWPAQDEIRVYMAMENVNSRIRLAGLDFNPGYLPWLKRKLVFEYKE